MKTRAPRLSPKARESKLKVYLSDVILLVLDHYTAAQIGEWLRDYKNVKIGRQAVWRFVKRIQIVLEHLDSCPMSAGDGVLAAMIRDAMIPTDTRRVIATPRAALVAEGGAPKSASTKPNAPEPMNPVSVAEPRSSENEATPEEGQEGGSVPSSGLFQGTAADRFQPLKTIPTDADIKALAARMKARRADTP